MGESRIAPSQDRSATAADRRPGTLSRWIIAGMILLWVAALLSRNVIRAHWWAYRLAVTDSAEARLDYFHRLAGLGDIAIYERTSNGPTINNGNTSATLVWETTVRADAAYNLTGGSDVELDAGHYFVMYNTRWDSTSGPSRSAISRLLLQAG